MHGALLDLVLLQLRGRLVRRARLLRQPRYLVATLVGIAYFVLVLGRRVVRFGNGRSTPLPSVSLAGHEEILRLAIGLAAAVALTVAWLLVSSRPALRLNESELELLLPAPLPRRQIVLYALLRQQPGILISALVIFFVRGSRWSGPSAFGFASLWAFLTMTDLHLKGISLWKARLKEIPPAAAGWRRGIALAVAAGWWTAAGVALLAAWRAAAAGAPAALHTAPVDFADAVARQAQGTAVGVLLAPFSWLAIPFGMAGTLQGARAVGVLALLALVALHAVWVVRSRASFEEATLERARRLSERKSVSRRQVRARGARHREAFALAWSGRPEAAILWKNLMLRGRTPLRTLAFVLAAIVVAATVTARLVPVPAAAIFQVAGIAMLCGIPLFSGLMLRNDLRNDLLYAEILRSWPLPGARLVLAEILAPIVSAFLVMLFGCGLATAGMVGDTLAGGEAHVLPLPSSLAGSHPVPAALVILGSLFVAGAGVVSLSVAVQNLAVLLLPSWVGLGLTRGRGTAILGGRILLAAGHLLVLLIAALPSLAILGVAAGLHLVGQTGFALWELPVLAALSTLCFAVETGILIRIAGAFWDRMDVSGEILAAAVEGR